MPTLGDSDLGDSNPGDSDLDVLGDTASALELCRGPTQTPCTVIGGSGVQPRECIAGVWRTVGESVATECDLGSTPVGGSCEPSFGDYTYPANRVGMFYFAWHAYAYDGLMRKPPNERFTLEDAIRRDDVAFADVIAAPGLWEEAKGFHFATEPADDSRCLYRARPGDAPPSRSPMALTIVPTWSRPHVAMPSSCGGSA